MSTVDLPARYFNSFSIESSWDHLCSLEGLQKQNENIINMMLCSWRTHFSVLQEENKSSSTCPRWFVMRHGLHPAGKSA